MADEGAGIHDSASPGDGEDVGDSGAERDGSGSAAQSASPDPGGHEVDGEADDAERARILRWIDQVPYLIVIAMMSAGIVIVAAAYFKRGPALIAGALLLAAAFRAVLGSERVGMLAVRTRWFDVLTFVGLAAVLIVLAWVAPQL